MVLQSRAMTFPIEAKISLRKPSLRISLQICSIGFISGVSTASILTLSLSTEKGAYERVRFPHSSYKTFMPEIYAIINQKGGVGKSTTALALACGLSAAGKRILCIDLDAQGNLSYTLGTSDETSSAMDVLAHNIPLQEAIQRSVERDDAKHQMPDVVAASQSLTSADLSITQTGKEFRLREAMEPVLDDYDYIVIDTPPALGILTINALSAATSAVIPAQADIYSLQGIGQLYSTLSAVRRYTNPNIRIDGILITRYNPRAILSRDITEMIENTAKQLDTQVFDAKIRESIAVKEAQANKQSLFDYAPRNNATLDYSAFIAQLLERSPNHGEKKL